MPENNLNRRDFKGKDFTGADFSDADIRGADFSNAVLVNTNFRNSKAGLPTSWITGLISLSNFTALFSGLVSGYAGVLIVNLFNKNSYNFYFFGLFSLITLIIVLIVILRRGLGIILETIAEIIAVCIAAIAFFPIENHGEYLTINALFTALALPGIMASIINMALAVALAKIIAIPGTKTTTGVIGFIGILFGIILGLKGDSNELAYLPAGLIGLLTITFGAYVGSQAINGNKKYQLIRSLTVGIVAYGGTSFRGANLTDADFTQATLTSVDFRQANLTRTCWFQSKNLEQARLEGTYLEQPNIRQLAITKDGREQEFNNLNLRYLNLENANLQDASFISTDLSEANLQNANLFGAKLAQTQLYQANLTTACLTGAYIENWGISTDTQLDKIECDYVYMRLPSNSNPDPWRKPDNRQETFKSGDFTDFIAPIIKTLDLYKTQNFDPRKVGSKYKTLDLLHYEGIDPTAAAIAIIQLAESYPEANLEIVALEGRGNDRIRLQARVASNANTSDLNQEYFQYYDELQSLPYSNLQELLIAIEEKDEFIYYLLELIKQAINQPKYYVETIQNQGQFTMSENSKNKNEFNIAGNVGNINAGDTTIEGDQTGIQHNETSEKAPSESTDKKSTQPQKILILAAIPHGLRLDKEIRSIEECIQRAARQDMFKVETRTAIRPQDIRRAIEEEKPLIVHFCGHGLADGSLVLEDDGGNNKNVPPSGLAALFELHADYVECVVLNACYSLKAASEICQHIKYAIGMNQPIQDKSAIQFAEGFYDGLGYETSEEQDMYQRAFKEGLVAIKMDNLSQADIPVIKIK